MEEILMKTQGQQYSFFKRVNFFIIVTLLCFSFAFAFVVTFAFSAKTFGNTESVESVANKVEDVIEGVESVANKLEGVTGNIESISDNVETVTESVTGKESAVTWREKAIVQAQKQNWGLSKGFLLTSLRLNPWDFKSWDLWFYLKEQTPIKNTFWSHTSWQSLYEHVGMKIDFWFLTWVMLLLLFFGAVFGVRIVIRYHIAKKTETSFERSFSKGLLWLLLGLIIFVIWINKVTFDCFSQWVVVQDSMLKTFSSQDSADIEKVLLGVEALSLQEQENWVLVKTFGGQVGWLPRESLYKIPSILTLTKKCFLDL
jgi:hypothetical protein